MRKSTLIHSIHRSGSAWQRLGYYAFELICDDIDDDKGGVEIRTEEGNNTGQLRVHSPEPNTLTSLPIFHTGKTEYNAKTKYYDAVQNRLLIFPSSLHHEVTEYVGYKNRYSISYDILITTKKEAGNFCLVNPSQWVCLTSDN